MPTQSPALQEPSAWNFLRLTGLVWVARPLERCKGAEVWGLPGKSGPCLPALLCGWDEDPVL